MSAEQAATAEHSAEGGGSIMSHILEEFSLTNEHAYQFFGIPLPHGSGMHFFGLDFSINKAVVVVWLATFLTIGLVWYTGRGGGLVARGRLRNLVEAIVQFIKVDIVDANIGAHEGKKWLPFIGSLFFLILFSNLLGLIPGSNSPTSNINMTATLAIIVFLTFVGAGMVKQGPFAYMKNLAPHGMPGWLYVILYPLEIFSQLAKPLSLALRLFANLLAGHILILSLLALIIMSGSIIVAPIPFAFSIIMYAFEIFVSFIQAYIFAVLSAIYIGAAIHPEH
ncbi:MAG: F0F1 ATP synthase subunit A [Candidatus Aquicultor sp.]|nr:F0F1 ATP synthase subunit A [Candidatus Aquicultor sp.]